MERRHGGAQPPENATNTAQPPENAAAAEPLEDKAVSAEPLENKAAAEPSENTAVIVRLSENKAAAAELSENNAEGALPPDGNAGGQAAQVRSPLYTRARLSGGFFSAVVVGMLLVNCVFSLTVVLIARAQGVETAVITGSEAVRYLSYLLYQLLYLGALAAVVFIYKEKPRAFGYRKTSWKYFLIALALQFGLLFSLDRANVYFIDLLGMLGYKSSSGGASSLPSLAGGGIVGVLVVVAVLPAVLEESLFRGVMLEGMKALGTAAACLLGGLCFSLFHQSPDQTVYQFICGAAFTLLALRADSLLPAVAAHFCNNALIVFNEKFGFLNHVSAGGEIAIYLFSALCLVGSLAWLIFFDKRGNAKRQVPLGAFVKPALPGIVVCVAMWIYIFVAGVL